MKQLNIVHRTSLLAAAVALGLAAATAAAAPDGYVPAKSDKVPAGDTAPGWQIALKLGFQGGYVVIPATENRVVRTPDGTVTEVNLAGPVEIHYTDPAADPRKRSRDIVAELGVGDMIKAISYPQ